MDAKDLYLSRCQQWKKWDSSEEYLNIVLPLAMFLAQYISQIIFYREHNGNVTTLSQLGADVRIVILILIERLMGFRHQMD